MSKYQIEDLTKIVNDVLVTTTVTPTKDLSKVLDSLETVELVMSLEDHYDIEVDDERWESEFSKNYTVETIKAFLDSM